MSFIDSVREYCKAIRADQLVFAGLVFAVTFRLTVRHVLQLLDRSAAGFFF